MRLVDVAVFLSAVCVVSSELRVLSVVRNDVNARNELKIDRLNIQKCKFRFKGVDLELFGIPHVCNLATSWESPLRSAMERWLTNETTFVEFGGWFGVWQGSE